MFPQTPARVQLSLWPAGLPSNGQGTVDWAGGLVDWNSQDIQSNGYYYATFESITVSCYNATSSPGTNKGVSYKYNGYTGTNDTVVDGTDPTVLSSFLATGTNKTLGAVASSGTSGAQPSTTVETVPGLTGGNPGVDTHSSSVAGGSSGTSTQAAGSSASSSSSSNNGFSQGNTGTSSKSGAEKLGVGQEKLSGSIFAGIVAFMAMMAL